VEVTGSGMNFLSGGVTLGFGTADVVVKQLWVLSPTRVVADVMVAPNAVLGTSEVSVISGFRSATLPNGFQLLPATSGPSIQSVANGTAGQATIYPGGLVSLTGSNLSSTGATSVTLRPDAVSSENGTPAQVVSASATQVTFLVPDGFATGVATLSLNNGSADSLALAIEIDPAPPAITAVTYYSGLAVDSGSPATVRDILSVHVTGLDPALLADSSRLVVTAGSVPMLVAGIVQGTGGESVIQVLLTQPPYGAQIPITVWVDGSCGASVSIPIISLTGTQ
jgi:uncharacterized protein (TIGR03437 family)